MIQNFVVKGTNGHLSFFTVQKETPLYLNCQAPYYGLVVFEKSSIVHGGTILALPDGQISGKQNKLTIVEIVTDTKENKLESTDDKEILIANTLIQLRAKAKIAHGDYVPNWDDNSYKYFPVFDMRNGGFAYTYSNCASTFSDTLVGSRFCFPTSTAAENFGKDNLELYRILYKG